MCQWDVRGHAWGTSKSVLQNVPYHKKHEYIFGRGMAISERFSSYKAFNEVNRVGMPGHRHGDFPISVIECVLS